MIYLNSLPYFKVFKRKAVIPVEPKSATKNHLVFIHNRSMEPTMKLIDEKHLLISSNNKFKSYYMDPLYKVSLFGRTKNINYKKERNEIYEDISKTTSITPYLTFNSLNNRNVYVDLYQHSNIFFSLMKDSLAPMKKIESYIGYMKSLIEDSKFKSYSSKIILMDIDDWTLTKVSGTTPISAIKNNPAMFILYAVKKNPEIFKSLGDIDIYFYTSEMIIRLNPSKVDDKTPALLHTEMNKMFKHIQFDTTALDDGVETKPEIASEENPRAEMNKAKFSDETVTKNNSDEDDKVDTEFEHEFDEDVKDEQPKDVIDISEELDDEEVKPVVEDEPDIIDTMDDELISAMNTEMGKRRSVQSPESIARNKALKEKQNKIVFENKTIEEYLTHEETDTIIDSEDISDHIASTNENIKTVKFSNYEKSYNEKLMKKDTVKIITNMNNASIPVYVRDIKVVDSSDELNYKETYTVLLEDENRVRHTLTFDMPKFIDDKFIYIGGNKKIISKQIFNKPIIKTGPDTVQVCSNYNKIFMYRYGTKMSPELEKFKKTAGNVFSGIRFTLGDNLTSNSKYVTTIDYDELSKSFHTIKTKDMLIMFNQKEISERYKAKPGEMCIGFYSNDKPIIMNIEDETVEGKSLIEFLVTKLSEANKKFGETYEQTTSGAKRYMYTRCKIMNKYIPIVLLLGYCEGLTTVLRKAKIKYYFTDKRPSITDKQEYIQFADGYLVYDRYPFENSLLMNGLLALPTKSFNYADMDEIEVYVDMFDSIYGARNLANAFDSFYDFMIDPITAEVLEDLGYPTDFVSVILLANSMLTDNSYNKETDMNAFRIRSNEVVNAILHKEIANAYFKYRITANNKNSVKISMKKDAVLKSLISLQTVEDYSTLNPIFEAKKLRNASLKGLSGMNLEQAFTIDKRGYDPTMVGIFGVSSSTDANVGVVRQLSLEPNIEGPRGYLKVENDLDKVKDVNMFTPAELLTPMGVTRDDGPRVSMATVQSTHIVPIKNSSPVLISNGAEQSIPYYLSSDFIIKADQDGEIVEVNEKTGIIIAKYKDGSARAIDIKTRMGKNSSSGFYVDNTLKCDLKAGDKFKKNDILAYEEKFFSNDGMNGTRMNIGSLEKVAIVSGYFTYEDSACITKKISDDMSTSVIMMKDVIIGMNANVDHMVNIGDRVTVGDTLVSFETSYDDASMNKFLASIGEELGEDIKNLNKIPIKSKYSGEIVDIKIYTTVELDELSPSLRKIVSNYYAKINARKKQVEKYDKSGSIVKAGMLMNEAASKLKPGPDGKIKGREVFDGVLIEFYIKYVDSLGVGDKLTYFSALKSVVCEVIDEGYEPYSEFRPDEEISTFVGTSAILARMVPSTIATIIGNKVIVELKRKLQEIYEK